MKMCRRTCDWKHPDEIFIFLAKGLDWNFMLVSLKFDAEVPWSWYFRLHVLSTC